MVRPTRLIFACLVWCISIVAPAAAGERVALVIGNSHYEFATPLNNPENDAVAVASVLEKLGFSVVRGLDLDRDALVGKIREFARQLRGADTALFYYSGHGLQVDGRNYLVPLDAKLDDEADLDFEAVEMATVIKQMEREPRTNLIFLDACRDNPLARNLARNMGTRSTAVGRGLARLDSGVGTLIAFSTQPGNVALDGEAGGNSPFTAALLAHIETPNTDISRVLRKVRQDVLAATNGNQVPWSSSSLIGDFYFTTAAATTATAGESDELTALRERLEQLEEKLANQQQAALQPSIDPAGPETGHGEINTCDLLAADPADRRSNGFGVSLQDIDAVTAVASCEASALNDPSSAVQKYQLARSYAAAGLTGQAAALLEELADAGDAAAMLTLARMQLVGNGVERNTTKALNLLAQAAARGMPAATSLIGYLHEAGLGVPRNYTTAAGYYRSAAEAGDLFAMKAQSRLLENGLGVGRDYAEANRWANRAAMHETAFAQLRLAQMLDSGSATASDAASAAAAAFSALLFANEPAARRLRRSARLWSSAFWQELQKQLRSSGSYTGPIDGLYGERTWAAIDAVGAN